MSTDSSQSLNIADFGERLRKAFNGASNAEIARKLRITPTAVGNHIKGRVTLPMLLEVSKSTGCSVDWLLTGNGEKYISPAKQINLDETFRAVVREVVREELARDGRKPVFTVDVGSKEAEKKGEKAA